MRFIAKFRGSELRFELSPKAEAKFQAMAEGARLATKKLRQSG
jgi:hypothetical protein